MSLQIYIAYGTAADQVTALRLQALGAVNGLAVYVPPASTRLEPTGQPDAQSEARLRESEVVLGVVTLALASKWESGSSFSPTPHRKRRSHATFRSISSSSILAIPPRLSSASLSFFAGGNFSRMPRKHSWRWAP